MPARALKWTCFRCRVSVARIDGRAAELPPTWSNAGETSFCLSCSRALAGEAAIDCAPLDSSREDLVRIRRNALIEFELDRTPEAANRTIARACHTSPVVVAKVRRRSTPLAGPLVVDEHRDER